MGSVLEQIVLTDLRDVGEWVLKIKDLGIFVIVYFCHFCKLNGSN